MESVRLGLSHANEATTRQYVKVDDIALGQAQLVRSRHFGGQSKTEHAIADQLDENFFDQAFEEFSASEQFEDLCSQSCSSSFQAKRPRVHVDPTHAGIENVPPPVAVPELSSSSGKSTTLNFSFVIN